MLMNERKPGYRVIDRRRVKPESRDSFPEIAKRLYEGRNKPLGDRGIGRRVPFDSVVQMLTAESDEKRSIGLRALCYNIEQLEKIIRMDYISKEERDELAKSTQLLRITLSTLEDESLHIIIGESNSLNLCMTVLNGDFSERAKEIAEKKVAEIKV